MSDFTFVCETELALLCRHLILEELLDNNIRSCSCQGYHLIATNLRASYRQLMEIKVSL